MADAEATTSKESLGTAASFLPRLARHSYLFESGPYSIRDAIYGSIPLSHAAYSTMDTRAFQRLKHIKQVGPVYLVYPGATHTRFSHSIGVYHLARLALRHLVSLTDIQPADGRATLAAAMLHDVGHFPLSHLIDELNINNTFLNHAELSADLITSDSELRKVLESEWEVDPELVANMVRGRPNGNTPRFLFTLLDGPTDIDKLDYLNRDAHHAGVPYGKVEVERLIEFLAVDPTTEELVIMENGIGTVESVIFAKYLMFRYIYWHHTARIATAMINRAILDVLTALGIERLHITDPRLRRLCLGTDATLEKTLIQLLEEANTDRPQSFSLINRVDQRRLYKRGISIPCAEAPQLDKRYKDAKSRRNAEIEMAENLKRRLGAEDIRDFDILIHVPPSAKFAADIRGVYVPGDSSEAHSYNIYEWESTPSPSYFTRDAVAAMEHRLRNIMYTCNLDTPHGSDIQRMLRSKEINLEAVL